MTTSPFNWQGKPSEIIAANKSWLAKPSQIAAMRDNAVSNFTTPIPGQSDAAAQFRIKASGSAA